MKFAPRPFQQVAIDHAVQFFQTASTGQRQPYAAPTGVGKSVVELGVQAALPGTWIVTPREEIIYGMLDKLGLPEDTDPLDHCISTPVRLRNRVLSGDIEPPKRIIFDEAHHHNADTWQQLDLLTGLCPCICYTATPYRGSPKGTREWLERWGEPLWIITFEEAVRDGYIALPSFEMLPLVDDDIVSVTGSGEFDVTSIDSVTVDRLGDLANHCKRWYSSETGWDRMTVFALSSAICCKRLQKELADKGIPTAIMSAETPKSQRRDIFKLCRERVLALLQIDIVSEGVDEPFRRLVDLSPTMSPVKWVQKLGRITRPTDEQPHYVCTNRNILRHAYALEGMVPVQAIVDTEQAFGRSERAMSRVLGLEAIGRFKPGTVKMLDGTTTHVYCMSSISGLKVVQYACLVRATKEPVWAMCEHAINEHDRTRVWGKWQLCPNPPSDVVGFGSVPGKAPSEKMVKWWQAGYGARAFGVDGESEPDRKSFQILPVLKDIGGWPT